MNDQSEATNDGWEPHSQPEAPKTKAKPKSAIIGIMSTCRPDNFEQRFSNRMECTNRIRKRGF